MRPICPNSWALPPLPEATAGSSCASPPIQMTEGRLTPNVPKHSTIPSDVANHQPHLHLAGSSKGYEANGHFFLKKATCDKST